MLKVFLCEDNKEQILRLEKYIRDIIIIEDLDMVFELATDNPDVILDKIKENSRNGIYILDIDLKSYINGIELADQIRRYDSNGFIIFITSHSEMTYLTFMYRIEAMDYIVKTSWKTIKDRIKQCLVDANHRYNSINDSEQKVFSLNIGDKVLGFEHKSIVFIETSINTHKLILHSEDREVEFYGKMKDVEIALGEDFIRTHKSYLVNRNKVEKVDKIKKIIYFNNGESCLASVRLIKNILK